MLEILVPGRAPLRLEYLALDVNGTLALEGELLPGVSERLVALSAVLDIRLITADTYGALDRIAAQLPVKAQRLSAGAEVAQKAALIESWGAERTAAIGNGANDAAMLRRAALGIAVLGPEGLAVECLQAADVLAPNIEAALDLLGRPRRLAATWRR